MRKFHALCNYVFLSEANLVSDIPLKKALSSLLSDKDVSKDSPIFNWFMTQYIKWIKRPGDDIHKSVFPYLPKDNDPEWTKRPGVVEFRNFEQRHAQKINHMIDFLKTLPPHELKSLYKEPYEVIEKKIEQWEKALAKQMTKSKNVLQDGVDYKVILPTTDANGTPMKWVQLLTPKACKHEGDSMGHCAGGYDPKKVILYSLHDESGSPHVTLEVQKKEIKQIKGKSNAAPIEKYIPPTVDFIKRLTSKGYAVTGDGENIGMLEYDENYYFEGTPQWDAAMKKIQQKQEDAFAKLRERIKTVDDSIKESYTIAYIAGI